MKYPEFRKMFFSAKWFGGHLCKQGDLYFKLSKNEQGKHLVSLVYNQLTKEDLDKISFFEKQEQEKEEREMEYRRTVSIPRAKLEAYVREQGTLIDRSRQSESEYWSCKGIDGSYYVRISGHKHPTGSMTDLSVRKIDLMSDNCAQYLKLFGLE